jgi:hypothetical protein
MQFIGDGKVWLEYGELIPVFCDCGNIYQPIEGSESSRCSSCGVTNDHNDDYKSVVSGSYVSYDAAPTKLKTND